MHLQLFLLICLLAFSIMAVMLRDLLKSAICLAAGSIFLAILFFRMDAPYAGVFEISVVAGLVTVLFITVITLTRGESEVKESKAPIYIFPVFFVIFILIDLLIMMNLGGQIPVLHNAAEGSFREVLWGRRTFDLVGHIGIIFAGVFAVLALFRKRNDENE